MALFATEDIKKIDHLYQQGRVDYRRTASDQLRT
jgi:hypothetical protein